MVELVSELQRIPAHRHATENPAIIHAYAFALNR